MAEIVCYWRVVGGVRKVDLPTKEVLEDLGDGTARVSVPDWYVRGGLLDADAIRAAYPGVPFDEDAQVV